MKLAIYYYNLVISFLLLMGNIFLIFSGRLPTPTLLALLPLCVYFIWRTIKLHRHREINGGHPIPSPSNLARNFTFALYIVAFCLSLFRAYTTLVVASGGTL